MLNVKWKMENGRSISNKNSLYAAVKEDNTTVSTFKSAVFLLLMSFRRSLRLRNLDPKSGGKDFSFKDSVQNDNYIASSISHFPFNIFHLTFSIFPFLVKGKRLKNSFTSLIIFFILTFIVAACNPFAPAYDENLSDGSTISDLTTTDGVFRNLQYAYTFKDTIIYGELISENFIFSFRNFREDQVFDDSWGREEEMRATYGLFQNAQRLDLIWNNVILDSRDSTTANIIRSFNLTVTLNPTDIIRVNGRVDMTLQKNPFTNKWAVIRWVDESDF